MKVVVLKAVCVSERVLRHEIKVAENQFPLYPVELARPQVALLPQCQIQRVVTILVPTKTNMRHFDCLKVD